MAVVISSVIKNSPADKKGIKSGDILLKIGTQEIEDFLDYRFYVGDTELILSLKCDGRYKKVKISKKEDEDLGLEFSSYLMDEQKRCKNKCIFCFIDQMPKGMRESLYFKDDDSRLSFLFGNYITLTNLSRRDVERIIKMHISPVNVSVHTMNKELRCKMMNNRFAGDCLDILPEFAQNGISINTQLVLCPGINDGDELRYSLEKLAELYPGVQSIACVPVGVTKYRDGLYNMNEYTEETAAETLDIIESFAQSFYEKHGTRLVWASDEFYLKAKREMPQAEYYENYSQIENGVGMCTNLREEFYAQMSDYEGERLPSYHVSLATGVAAYPLIKELADKFMAAYEGYIIDVHEIKNDFFGHSITVAGLITGKDLINQLKDKALAETLLIPSVMLRSEGDVFLDDVSREDVERALSVKLELSDCTGAGLFYRFLGI